MVGVFAFILEVKGTTSQMVYLWSTMVCWLNILLRSSLEYYVLNGTNHT
jgi:hypothetical protein